MAENVTFSHVYGTYLENNEYKYPNQHLWSIPHDKHQWDTGWHIVPNILWKHYASPKDMAHLEINYESYSVSGGKCTIFNPIPMTSQVNFQRTSIFTAFNNCMYILGTSDPSYETNWFSWYESRNYSPPLFYKEGIIYEEGANEGSAKRYMWPRFKYNIPNARPTEQNTFANMADMNQGCYPSVNIPTGVIWDPMEDPSSIMELRPGKNAMSFHWEVHDVDKDKWFNLDNMAWWYPYGHANPFPLQMPGQYHLSMEVDPDRLQSRWQYKTGRDYTMADFMDCPVLPMSWWWKEMAESIIPNKQQTALDDERKQAFLRFPGTERELCHYPPMQWFAKGVPLFDEHESLIKTIYFCSVKIELYLKGKKRRSKIWAPTWGPFNQSIYTAKTEWTKWTGSYIRYRTGGMRRTWLNYEGEGKSDDTGTGTTTVDKAHPRETPYFRSAYTDSIPGDTSYSLRPEPKTGKAKPPDLQVTFHKDDDRVVIERPQVLKRKTKPDIRMRTPSPRLDDQEIYQHTHM